jgi:hypothetical protein
MEVLAGWVVVVGSHMGVVVDSQEVVVAGSHAVVVVAAAAAALPVREKVPLPMPSED